MAIVPCQCLGRLQMCVSVQGILKYEMRRSDGFVTVGEADEIFCESLL